LPKPKINLLGVIQAVMQVGASVSTFYLGWARVVTDNGSEDRENFGWVKNSKMDFSLARNTIVLWTIQSRHWAKRLRSCGQYKVTIGQSAFILVENTKLP